MHLNPARLVAGGAALAVTAGLAGVPAGLVGAPAHAAAPDPAAASDGAAWLTGQLTDGLLVGEFGPDAGLTIDAALALDAVGADAAVQTIADAIATEVDADNPAYNYVSGEAFGDAGSTYAGAVAKTVVLAQEAGRDTATFGGEDFVARLEATVEADGPGAGRIADTSSFGDSANLIGQSFAARGLARAGSGLAPAATDYVVASQCDDGFFTLAMSAVDVAPACPDGATPSTDVTALVVLNLLPQAADPDVAAALDDAVTWLRTTQGPDGSFGSDAMITTANANSTGLAAWVLGASGSPTALDAAERAATWLRAHQLVNTATCAPYPAADEGAIAYDDAALAEGEVTEASRDQYRRATAQALPGLAYAPQGVFSDVTSPLGYVKAGSTQRVVLDASPGDLVCLVRDGAVVASRRVPTVGTLTVPVRLPAGAGTRRVRVEDGDETLGTAVFRALGAKRLTVRAPDAVRRGARAAVVVRGLAPREQVAVAIAGRRVAAGRATAAGAFTRRVVVPRAAPLGRRVVSVVGEFATRSGRTALRVLSAR